MDLIGRFPGADGTTWKVLRWAAMTAVLFWAVVYRLGTDGSGLPQFVYVNF